MVFTLPRGHTILYCVHTLICVSSNYLGTSKKFAVEGLELVSFQCLFVFGQDLPDLLLFVDDAVGLSYSFEAS